MLTNQVFCGLLSNHFSHTPPPSLIVLKQVIGEKCLDSVNFDQEMKRRKQSKLDASRVTSVARLTRISINWDQKAPAQFEKSDRLHARCDAHLNL
ncbi:Uncharacterized protein APZ42_023372 [Daphnia magna]|uniref:Uncharacterized protein n=1 Tax=Daphnia magna TaxID=35525 RepID=A0A164V0D5_9CRUS|nr:Uncharacterized protein APZ42_023372 [Daphnia magna]